MSLCCTALYAQPTITSITPNGSHLFNSATTLSFVASSAVGVTNVTVQLTQTSLAGSSFLQNLTQAHGLTVTGPNTGETVSHALLKSDVLYSAVIQATDANGNTTSTSVSFDTIAPSYTFEAEDYDYNGGQFFDSPQTNAYAGLAGTAGVDCQHNGSGGSAYRPNPLATELNGDSPRVQYQGAATLTRIMTWASTTTATSAITPGTIRPVCITFMAACPTATARRRTAPALP